MLSKHLLSTRIVCYIFLKPVENSKRSKNNNDNSLKLRQHLTVIKGYHLLPPWVFVTHYKIGMYKVTGQWGKQSLLFCLPDWCSFFTEHLTM